MRHTIILNPLLPLLYHHAVMFMWLILLWLIIHSLKYTDTRLGEMIISFRPLFLVAHGIVFIILCIRTRKEKKKIWQLTWSHSYILIAVWLAFFLPVRANIYYVDGDYGWNFWTTTTQQDTTGIPILYANILKTNTNYEEIRTLIDTTNPSILFFAERQPHHSANIPLLETYPYSDRYSYGSVIFSKIPFTSLPSFIEPRSGRSYPRITLPLDDKEWRIDFVHTTSPTSPKNFHQRNRQLDFLAEKIRQESWSYLIVGDFNITPHSVHYKHTLWLLSWLSNLSMHALMPQTRTFGNLPLLPAAHIDHLFVSKPEYISNFHIIPLQWSDHHAFFFTLIPSSPSRQ